MSVYILHFNKRIGSVKHSVNHYIGFTRKPKRRIKQHLQSPDTPVTRAFRAANATFAIGKIFDGATRDFERYLKRVRRKASLDCLICREERIIKKQIGVKKLMSEKITAKYYVAGITDDGETFLEKPIILTTSELHNLKEKYKDEESIQVIVIQEFTVNHILNRDDDISVIGSTISVGGQCHLPIKPPCNGMFVGHSCRFNGKAEYPKDNPTTCGNCWDLLAEDYQADEAAPKSEPIHPDEFGGSEYEDIPF